MKKLLFLLFFAALWLHGAPQNQYTPDDFRRISAMLAKVLDKNHYSDVRMSDELSCRIFDNFIDDLDPERIFFSEDDLKPLSNERLLTGYRLQQGEYSLAFQLYELFRKRYAEYREFSRKFLSGKIDFTKNENYSVDRRREPRCKNKRELAELWSKYLKHQLLIYKLMELNDTSDKAGKVEKDKKKITGPSPEKRILQRQRDFGNAIEKREKIDILGILLNAMATTYGAHSSYQPPKASEDFDIHMSLSLIGIGATLTSENGYIKIVELVPGGPAARSGKLKVNDRLIRVTQENGESTDLIDMPVSQAVTFIRGEKGSKITIDVLSGEAGNISKVTLVREKINLEESAAKGDIREIPHRSGKMLKVGVITLPGFYMNFNEAASGNSAARRASTDVKNILERFNKAKVDSILFDLRRNGGGSLPDAIVMAGLFMKGGPVVRVKGKENSNLYGDEDPGIVYSGPLVVLTSKLSASAAEIFSAALRDSGRAVMVGDSRTFGKSTVLNVEDLTPYNSLFRRVNAGTVIFESAMFYRITGCSVQQLGVQPDILLPSLTEEMEIGEMYYDNHLPWDQTAPAAYKAFDPAIKNKIAVLKANSARRIAASAEYGKLLRQIELYRKIRNRKNVSLNEMQRRQEYAAEKQLIEETEKIMEESGSSVSGKDKKSSDPVLSEAVNIAADLAQL